jgi:hypothetical protein
VPFEKWSEPFKKGQDFFQALTVLNIKTLESFTYLKPENLANLKNPEELLEKQMSIVFDNGHKTLDYIQKSFQIMEKAFLSLGDDAKNKTDVKKQHVKE